MFLLFCVSLYSGVAVAALAAVAPAAAEVVVALAGDGVGYVLDVLIGTAAVKRY